MRKFLTRLMRFVPQHYIFYLILCVSSNLVDSYNYTAFLLDFSHKKKISSYFIFMIGNGQPSALTLNPKKVLGQAS